MKIKLLMLALCVAAAHARGHRSAASEAQIRFAIENKYDDTGPGAKQREFAYKTFTNLEEALMGYLDDPDTKLPDTERARAYRKFGKPLMKAETSDHQNLYKVPLKTTGFSSTVRHSDEPIYVNRYTFPDKKVYYHEPHSDAGIFDLRGVDSFKVLPKLGQKFKKSKSLKPNHVSLGRYTTAKPHVLSNPIDDAKTEYSFSYGVHDRHTGDQKAAHETRSNGRVTGYYTVMDADGKQRTVRYTADDKDGFRAVVQRTQTNTQ